MAVCVPQTCVYVFVCARACVCMCVFVRSRARVCMHLCMPIGNSSRKQIHHISVREVHTPTRPHLMEHATRAGRNPSPPPHSNVSPYSHFDRQDSRNN